MEDEEDDVWVWRPGGTLRPQMKLGSGAEKKEK